MINTHPLIAYSMFALAILLGIISLFLFVFRKRRKKTKRAAIFSRQKPLPVINYENLDKVAPHDKDLIQSMGIRMLGIHGHMDLTGLMSDRGNGMPINELMEKPCSECGILRNKRGLKRDAM